MNAKDRPLIGFDWAMKNMLRNKANHDILEGFLSVLLKQDIKILAILESEGNQQYPNDKFNRVDLVVENANKEIIVVEVQNNREVHYFARLLYGASKLIVDHIQAGESYEKVGKVISVSILYFLLGEGGKRLRLSRPHRVLRPKRSESTRETGFAAHAGERAQSLRAIPPQQSQRARHV